MEESEKHFNPAVVGREFMTVFFHQQCPLEQSGSVKNYYSHLE